MKGKKPEQTEQLEIGVKLPPQAIELEEAVLGALMLEKSAITENIEDIHSGIFYKEQNQIVFDAISILFQQGEPVDILTVTQKLRSMGKLEQVGGAYYVAQLVSKVSSAANIETHIQILIEMSVKRQMISVGAELQKMGYNDTMDAFEVLEFVEKKLFQVATNNFRNPFQTAADLTKKVINRVHELIKEKGGMSGVPSGFIDIDRITSGWQKSDLVIIAARPGMGKTALMAAIARNAAIEFKKPVAIFSLEMSGVQLMERLISGEAEIDNHKFMNPKNMKDTDLQLLNGNKVSGIYESNLFIDDTGGLSLFEFRAKSRRMKAKHNIELIIVDYLQLMTDVQPGNKSTNGNREQEISRISRGLKLIAKELDIPIIALSQLSRQVEQRSDKTPQLSDLRESGSIEQDADMVIFLFRPEYYGINVWPNGVPVLPGETAVIIAKHRKGALETVYIQLISRFTKFVNKEQEQKRDDTPPPPPEPPARYNPHNFSNGTDFSGKAGFFEGK